MAKNLAKKLAKKLPFKSKPKALDYHVIQSRQNSQANWHTIPGLVYESLESATERLPKFAAYKPGWEFRVRPWHGERVSVMRPAVRAA